MARISLPPPVPRPCHSPAVQPGGGNLCQFGIRSGAFLIRLVASGLQHRAQAILLERGEVRPLPA